MSRTKLTKRVREAKQQEAVRRQQSRTVPGSEMQIVESTKRNGTFNGRDVKIKLLLPRSLKKKQVKIAEG